ELTALSKSNPGDRAIFFNRAILMDKIGLISGALKEYGDLLDGATPTAAQLNNRGVARLKTNMVSQAAGDFMAASSTDNSSAEAYFNMAVVNAYKGLTKKTIEFLDKAVELDDSYKAFIFNNPAFSVMSEDPRFDKFR
ncbi:MAG: hypothetical protein AAF391_08780, partial [Bacteroidota bacterium]